MVTSSTDRSATIRGYKLTYLKRQAEEALGKGNFRTAWEKYTEAINLAGNDKQDLRALYSNRSLAYSRAGRHEEALEDALQARSLAPHWEKACWRHGKALAGLGRWPEAVQAFHEGWKLSKDDKEFAKALHDSIRRLTRNQLGDVLLQLVQQEVEAGRVAAPRYVISSNEEMSEAAFSVVKAEHTDCAQGTGLYYDEYQQWLMGSVDAAQAYTFRGKVFLRLGEYLQAQLDQETAVKLLTESRVTEGQEAEAALTAVATAYMLLGDSFMAAADHPHRDAFRAAKSYLQAMTAVSTTATASPSASSSRPSSALLSSRLKAATDLLDSCELSRVYVELAGGPKETLALLALGVHRSVDEVQGMIQLEGSVIWSSGAPSEPTLCAAPSMPPLTPPAVDCTSRPDVHTSMSAHIQDSQPQAPSSYSSGGVSGSRGLCPPSPFATEAPASAHRATMLPTSRPEPSGGVAGKEDALHEAALSTPTAISSTTSTALPEVSATPAPSCSQEKTLGTLPASIQGTKRQPLLLAAPARKALIECLAVAVGVPHSQVVIEKVLRRPRGHQGGFPGDYLEVVFHVHPQAAPTDLDCLREQILQQILCSAELLALGTPTLGALSQEDLWLKYHQERARQQQRERRLVVYESSRALMVAGKEDENRSLVVLPYKEYALVNAAGQPVERVDKHPFCMSRVYYDSTDIPGNEVWAQPRDSLCRWRQSAGEVRVMVLKVEKGVEPAQLKVDIEPYFLRVSHRLTGEVFLEGELDRGVIPADSYWTHDSDEGCVVYLQKMNLELFVSGQEHRHSLSWWPRLFVHHSDIAWDDYEKDYSDLPAPVMDAHQKRLAQEDQVRLQEQEEKGQREKLKAMDEKRRQKRVDRLRQLKRIEWAELGRTRQPLDDG